MNWQPIETAPRDGRSVLLFTPGDGRWIGAPAKPQWCLVEDGKPVLPKSQIGPPTHWMPLPEPPE